MVNSSIYNIHWQIQYADWRERGGAGGYIKGSPGSGGPCYLLPCKQCTFAKGFEMASYLLTAVRYPASSTMRRSEMVVPVSYCPSPRKLVINRECKCVFFFSHTNQTYLRYYRQAGRQRALSNKISKRVCNVSSLWQNEVCPQSVQ